MSNLLLWRRRDQPPPNERDRQIAEALASIGGFPANARSASESRRQHAADHERLWKAMADGALEALQRELESIRRERQGD